jgi:predicted aminopeptidase
MKRILKFSFIIITVLIALLTIVYLPLIRYGLRQLKGQLSIIMNTVPIEEALKSDEYDDKQKKKLEVISNAKAFAIEHLGLKANKNYTEIYNQHSKPLLWIVTASEPFRLKPYEWEFPLVGKVFYKGYFNMDLAIEEEQRIASLGYDTDVSEVSAWSTLGFFKDPVLSDMLNRSEGRLAELIIHEMTHATIYIESDVDFNENLATFIGEQGAVRYIEHRYGIRSEQYSQYTSWLTDKEIFGRYMVDAATRLDSLYNTFTKDDQVRTKAVLKYDLILDVMRGINRLNLTKPGRYRFDPNQGKLPDNTYFISYLKYRRDQDIFLEELHNEFNDDLRSFFEAKKEEYGS